MSTGPRTQSTFIQGNQSTVGQDASHSALFYLFQEVSKLESPFHGSFMDSNSPSLWQDHFTVEKEEHYSRLFYPINGCNQSLNQPAKDVQESLANSIGAVSEPLPERNSPLKALTLINLQCERLLQPSDAAESGRSSVTESGQSRNSSPSTAAFVPGQEADSDSLSFKVTLGRLLNERQEITVSVSHVKDENDVCGYKLQTDCKKLCNVKPQTAENTRPEQVEENTEASSQPPESDAFSGSKRLEWDNEKGTEENTRNSPLPGDAFCETHIPNASCNNQQLTLNVSEEANVAKPTLILDHNANLYFSTHPAGHTLLPQRVLLQGSSSERCCLIDESTASMPECKQTSHLTSMGFCVETTPTTSATLQSEPRSVEEEGGDPGTQQCASWRTKTPRKQPHPSRSADMQDPDFQGVTFRMDTEVDDSSEQCRLLITSKYSKNLPKSAKKPRLRTRPAQKPVKTSSSEEECDQPASVSKGKVCASCCTRKTPMWRDAEDGTPLCNACGIRYKKYRVRCVNCWHIPRKEGNSNSRCLKCGNFVRLISAQRKCTT